MEKNNVLAFKEMYDRVYETKKSVDDYYQYRLPNQNEAASVYFRNLAKNYLQKNPDDDGSNLHLLDVGCGSGRQTKLLANYFGKVTALDISEAQIAKAKEAFPAKNISYMVGTSSKLPVDNDSIDLISCIYSAHFFPDIIKFVKECNRVLKSGGVVGIRCDNLVDVTLASHAGVNTNSAAKQLCIELYAECRKYCISVGHGSWHVLDCYRTLFKNITGMEKSLHNAETYDISVTMEGLLSFSMSIPMFREVEWAWKNFTEKLKQLWNLESVENKDINLRVTLAPYVIILRKT